MLKPVVIAVFVCAVILVECVFAYFLIPGTSDLEKWAKNKEGEHTAAGKHGKGGCRKAHKAGALPAEAPKPEGGKLGPSF